MNNDDMMVHNTAKMYGHSRLGYNAVVLENVMLGYPDASVLEEIARKKIKVENHEYEGTVIGDSATIRPNSTIYCRVTIGNNLRTGHNILIRENTTIGDNVLIGTNTIIDGYTTVGSNVSIQGNVYIPTNTTIEDNVFIGPCVVLANDKYPVRKKYDLKGPVIGKGVSVGANSTILPGIEIGEGAMVAAGALVTKDVPPWKLAIGAPAKVIDMPEDLKVLNII